MYMYVPVQSDGQAEAARVALVESSTPRPMLKRQHPLEHPADRRHLGLLRATNTNTRAARRRVVRRVCYPKAAVLPPLIVPIIQHATHMHVHDPARVASDKAVAHDHVVGDANGRRDDGYTNNACCLGWHSLRGACT
jgi:hypothetical protein